MYESTFTSECLMTFLKDAATTGLGQMRGGPRVYIWTVVKRRQDTHTGAHNVLYRYHRCDSIADT